jgi:hypothetical protein
MVEKPESAATEDITPALSQGERRAHQKAIGQGLRKFFNAVVSEPIPDEFLILLQKMDGDKQEGEK